MNPAELLDFMRHHSLAVQASVSAAAAPQGAVVGFVVTDRFELFFDTVDTTRKVQNLRRNPKIAFVIGGLTGGESAQCSMKVLPMNPAGPSSRASKRCTSEPSRMVPPVSVGRVSRMCARARPGFGIATS